MSQKRHKKNITLQNYSEIDRLRGVSHTINHAFHQVSQTLLMNKLQVIKTLPAASGFQEFCNVLDV